MNSKALDQSALNRRDLIILVLLTLAWGVNWPIMKYGVREMEPLTFRSLCMLGGIPLLFFIIRRKGLTLAIPRKYWRESFWIALTNMVGWYVFAMYGVKLLSSGRAAILGYTMPIWVALFGYLMAAGAIWGLGTHLMKRRKQSTHVYVVTFWSLSLALLVCGLIALSFERAGWLSWFYADPNTGAAPKFPSTTAWLAVLYNSVVVFTFAQVAWFRLTLILTPVASGLSIMMIPVVGVFSGMWMLGEQAHWNDYAALATMIGAIACVLWPTASSTRDPKS
jgi:drug/metabolite transporter (DMT)-like permease